MQKDLNKGTQRKKRERKRDRQTNILQWKPLNVITLGWVETDNINLMTTITGHYHIVMHSIGYGTYKI